MLIQRQLLCSLDELKWIANQHLYVRADEAARLVLAQGLNPADFSIPECVQQVRLLITSRTEQDFIGCVRIGDELWDAYRINHSDAICLGQYEFREEVGLTRTLVIARYYALAS